MITEPKSRAVMNTEYWNRGIRDYDREVLDSIGQDRKGIILRRLGQYAHPDQLAADFGCGVGKYLTALSRRFKRVYAIDFATRLLNVARKRCAATNVTFRQGDLAAVQFRMRRAHFGICQNVLISPDRRKPRAILRNIRRHLVRDGRLMLLVPSTESALYANQRLVEWNRNEGLSGPELTAEVEAPRTTLDLVEGVYGRDGVPTKHYLREEALMMVEHSGFEPREVDKVEYNWDSEFADPPDWMRDPYPWDWLIVADKSARAYRV